MHGRTNETAPTGRIGVNRVGGGIDHIGGTDPVRTAVLAVVGDRLEPLSPWPFAIAPSGAGTARPWNFVARSGVSLDLADVFELDEPAGVTEPPGPAGHGDRGLDGGVARALAGDGVGAVWCRPVWVGSRVAEVVVACPEHARGPHSREHAWLASLVAGRSRALGGQGGRAAPAASDPLTGAGTPRQLQHAIDEGVEGAAVLYLDLDGLAAINATYGAGGGDTVLVEVARRLAGIMRAGDLVVRTAGDEFVLVIREAAEIAGIRAAARAIDELALPYEIGGEDGSVLVSVSAGVGLCVQCAGTGFDVAVHAAFGALERAKRAGRDHLHVVSR